MDITTVCGMVATSHAPVARMYTPSERPTQAGSTLSMLNSSIATQPQPDTAQSQPMREGQQHGVRSKQSMAMRHETSDKAKQTVNKASTSRSTTSMVAAVAAKRRPLDSSSKFIDKVLLPELICLVIREDYRGDVTMQEAEQIRRESIRYGHLVFPSRPVEGKSIDDDDSDNEVRSCTPPSSQKKRSIKPPRPHKVVSQKQSHNIRPIPLSQKRREVEDDETPLLASSSQSMPTASSSSLSLSSSSSASTLAPFSSWDPLPSTPQAISSSSQEPTPSLQAVLEFDASPRKRQRLESLPLSQDSSIAILSSRKQVGDATMNIAEASPTVCLVSDDDDDEAKGEPAQQRPAKTTLCSQTSSVRRKREPQRTILSHTLSQPSPSVVKHDHFRVTGSASTL